MKKDLLIVVGLILMATLGIGAIAVLPFLQGQDEKPKTVPPKTELIAELPKKKEGPKKPAEPVKKSAPRAKPVSTGAQTDQKEKTKEPAAETKQETKKPDPALETKKQEEKKQEIAKAQVKIEPKKVDKLIVLDNIFKINDPDGEFTVETLNRGKEIILLGKVKTLKIAGANEGAILNACEFEAQDIILTGNINGAAKILLGKAQTIHIADVNNGSLIDASASAAHRIVLAGNINSGSSVKLHAPEGTIEINGEINDRAGLDIDAPAGKVLIKGRGASSINSNTKVRILARHVELNGAVNGPQTNIDITLSKDGSLKFERLHGGVHLLYRKAAAADPEPRIEAGSVDANAEFRMLPAEKK
jgi:hypothetical protein